MQIKRFEAKNMAEAFKNIKQEFGPDAVILSAKTIQKERGLFDTVRASRVEVLAANDSYVVPREETPVPRHLFKQYEESAAPSEARSKSKMGNSMFQSIGNRLKPVKSFKVAPNNPHNEKMADIQALKDMKNLLLAQGVENDIALKILEQIQKVRYGKGKGATGGMPHLLYRALEEMGVASTPAYNETDDKSMICLVGLTGVGKTTTLAKLAAIDILNMNRSVGVISLDNLRVGSNALLNVYANIIGFPVRCVSTPKEAKVALKDFRDKDTVLIDTPGMALNHHQQKYEIKELLDRLGPDEVHLLIHANVKNSDASEIMRQFELFECQNILFTKIDETATYGTIVNQLVKTGKPISYITNGQNIPEDIMDANVPDIADLLTEGEADDHLDDRYGRSAKTHLYRNRSNTEQHDIALQ